MPSCRIDLEASPTFQKLLRQSRRQYPKVRDDLIESFSRIEKDYTGACQAVAVPGFASTVWKYRYKSSDFQVGSRGGIRIIAYYDSAANILYPLFFYFKKNQSDTSGQEINAAIAALKQALEAPDDGDE